MTSKVRLFAALVVMALAALACGTPATPPAVATQQPPTSSPELPLVEAPQILQFYMANENAGWGTTETKVVRTYDGGVTWYDVTPPGLEVVAYSPYVFRDSQTAWLLIPGPDPLGEGTLYRTADGGLTWNSASTPFGFASLQFLDSINGFAMADLGAGAGSQAVAIYQTLDGGATWRRNYLNDPTVAGAGDSLPLGGQKYGVTFRDSMHGWVGGSIPMEGVIYLYATQDGGQTWAEQKLAMPAGFENAFTGADAPLFFSAAEGVLPVGLATDISARVFYRTTDGGATWTAGQPAALYGWYDIVSPLDFFIWNGAPLLSVTHDGGMTWSEITPNVDLSALLTAFQFVNSNVGWALASHDGADTTLYKTSDGGVTWTVLVP